MFTRGPSTAIRASTLLLKVPYRNQRQNLSWCCYFRACQSNWAPACCPQNIQQGGAHLQECPICSTLCNHGDGLYICSSCICSKSLAEQGRDGDRVGQEDRWTSGRTFLEPFNTQQAAALWRAGVYCFKHLDLLHDPALSVDMADGAKSGC